MQDSTPNPPLPPRDENAEPSYDCWEDKKYFDEYAKMDIHCDMLHDRSRMMSYYRAISENPQDFKDKVVLDVGCGTGILSCWCAKAGAAKVYAVEACNIADQAELIVLHNGLSDIVKVIRGKIENITLPEKVDVIISEWMGSFLLFESMLDAVLYARDTWLKQGGKMYPCQARLYVAPISADRFFEKKVGSLRDVSGIDMSALVPFATREMTTWGIRGRRIRPESVLADPHCLKIIDLYLVQPNDLQKTASLFHFTMKKAGKLRGFGTWFDVAFPPTVSGELIILSTHPDNPVTHWRHDQFLLENAVVVTEETEVRGCVRMMQNHYWKRHFDFEFSFSIGDTDYHKVFST